MDVDQDLVRALPAVDRQRPRLGPEIDALGLAITAERADQKAVLYCQEHITFAPELQEFSTPSLKIIRLSRQKENKESQRLRFGFGRCFRLALTAAVRTYLT